jgi:uncharacterized UPF0160 family protein
LESARDRILILPVYAPWKNVVDDTDIEFIVYPSNRGGYNAQAVPRNEEIDDRDKVDDKNNGYKIAFPEEWRGLDKDKLRQITAINTISFCHRSGFMVAADTLEDTVKACEMARK